MQKLASEGRGEDEVWLGVLTCTYVTGTFITVIQEAAVLREGEALGGVIMSFEVMRIEDFDSHNHHDDDKPKLLW